jgi:hypothetical protein
MSSSLIFLFLERKSANRNSQQAANFYIFNNDLCLFMMQEIPADFLKKHGSQLQPCVQLQGILEGSPVRDVGISRVSYKSDGRPRFFLKDGWHDFVRDNMLQVGQTADSYFEVREVINPLNPGLDRLDIGQWLLSEMME